MYTWVKEKSTTKDTHDRDIWRGACVSGYRALMCECAFRKGGKTPNAHAPTWASIRAVHATLSLPLLHTYTRIHRHLHAAYGRETCSRAPLRTCTRTYICTRVSWNEKAFCFCNVDGSTFWWLNKCGTSRRYFKIVYSTMYHIIYSMSHFIYTFYIRIISYVFKKMFL